MPSPPMMVVQGTAQPGLLLPSTRTWCGGRGSRAMARRIASMLAQKMLRVSISATEAAAMEISAPAARRAANSSTRVAALSFLESSMPVRSARGRRAGRITAAASTGPASGPRPTSSTPATTPPIRRSCLKWGIAQSSKEGLQ